MNVRRRGRTKDELVLREIEPKTKSGTKETQKIGIIHRKPHNNYTRNNSTVRHYKGKQRLLIDTRLRGKLETGGKPKTSEHNQGKRENA